MFGFGRPELKKLPKQPQNDFDFEGTNRRAVSIVPGPTTHSTQDIKPGDQSKFRQMLLSIEANQSSCCIKVTSPRHRSRAAVLVFRGRVVGCIYGSKRLVNQVFGQEAYSCILADISHQTNTIDAYILSESLVLAAASLFNGEIFNPGDKTDPEDIFETAHRGLVHSGMPGCIVIKDKDELPIALVYVFGGQIVGVYAHKDGWVSNTYETALQYLVRTPGAKVSASMLAARNINEVNAISFSLSGLNDQKPENKLKPSAFETAYALVTNYDRQKVLDMVTPMAANSRFIPRSKNPALHSSRNILNR